ncbi:MAG: selenide, water dikinase SelD [Pseudomonadota bacterium]
MDDPNLPKTRDIALVGGGHTHALVLRRWGMAPLAGARLTVINPGPTAPYSGMLPGFVAGHYTRDELDIDLVRLCRFAGARLVVGAATDLDLAERLIHVPGRPPIAFDIASIDIGITSGMPELEGFDRFATPAKPLGQFAERWDAFVGQEGAADVAIIGGGVAGVELAMAMAFALKTRGREARVRVIERETALSALGSAAARRVRARLAALDIDMIENAGIAAITADGLRLADGCEVAAGFVTGAAGARPYDWLAGVGLRHRSGFLEVRDTLQTSDPDIFAVGDCAAMERYALPRAGVYAVRQAPVLFHNLRARASGGVLKDYRPQRDYLKLISLGERNAIGERFGVALSGPGMWRLKDRIDQRFMTKFRELPAMSPPALPSVHADGLREALGDKPMCGGCGAKVGRGALTGALGPPETPVRPDITPAPGDDAAILTTGLARQVFTSDHLRAFTEDPVRLARIAAVHALGDIWAMGAAPQAATTTVILPRLSPALQERTLREVMEAAREVMHAAGAEIVGGHSSTGTELTIGFSVTGLCESNPITLIGGRDGDALILTKPLGSGVLMAAEMAGEAKGAWVLTALELMCQPQGQAALHLADAHAMTDVTGFGLAGHLWGICEGSRLSAELDLDAIPLMTGAEELSQRGVRSTLFRENRAIAPWIEEGPRQGLLFDPQTAGGLLAAVAPDAADAILGQLREEGYHAARIGTLRAGAPHIALASGRGT